MVPDKNSAVLKRALISDYDIKRVYYMYGTAFGAERGDMRIKICSRS